MKLKQNDKTLTTFHTFFLSKAKRKPGSFGPTSLQSQVIVIVGYY